jgi:hypothetical protein
MSTRFIMGYSMLAAMAAAGLFALWFFVLRHHWSRSRRRIRGDRERAARSRSGAQPAFQAE